MGNSIGKKIAIYVDMSPAGDVQQSEFNLVANYLANHPEVTRLYIFIESQSEDSEKKWRIFAGEKEWRNRISILRDNLVNNDPYISAMYRVANTYLKESPSRIKIECLFLPSNVGMAKLLVDDYQIFKQQLAHRRYMRKLRLCLIDPKTYEVTELDRLK